MAYLCSKVFDFTCNRLIMYFEKKKERNKKKNNKKTKQNKNKTKQTNSEFRNYYD